MRKVSGTAFLVVAVFVALIAALVWAQWPASTPAIRESNGKRVLESIASLEKIQIGGMDQWILVRGRAVSNPILLWLHGGPGAAQMAVARQFNGALEEHFVVVHWDQRGAGKSNAKSFDETTMTFQRFLADAHELTRYLKGRFARERIYLVGHSWGTQLGIKLVQAHPENYYAYVGVSQHVDAEAAAEIAHAWVRAEIRRRGKEGDLKQLQVLGPPPYVDHGKFVRFNHLIDAYGGNMDIGLPSLLWIAVRAPEYRLSDLLAWFRGASRGSGPMWMDPDYRSYNAMGDVPRLLVPIYFFSGRHDYNTPLELVRGYFEQLKAPRGKALIVFEESAHTPFLAEPEEFNRALIRVKEQTYGKERDADQQPIRWGIGVPPTSP